MSAPTPLEAINDRLEKLDTLTADEIVQLDADLEALYKQADEDDDLDTMDSVVTGLEKMQELRDIAAEKAETETETKNADKEPTAEVEPEADDTKIDADTTVTVGGDDDTKIAPVEPDKGTPADEDKSTTAEIDADDAKETTAEVVELETKVEPEAKATTTDDTKENTAMAASADFQPPEDAKPLVASASTNVFVGPNIQGFTAGASFDSLTDVNTAFLAKLHAVQRMGAGEQEKFSVASLVASIPEDRMLSRMDIEENMAKIDSVVEPEAILASGGYCAPLQVKYDIFGMGSTARPVRDSLPSFGAARGGIRYVAPPRLGEYGGAISLWTAENDRNPAEDGDGVIIPKPVLKVDCAAELTAETDAVTLQLEFGNLMSRAYPELVQRHNALALVEHARFAERNLLSQINGESTQVTSAFKVGTARDFLLAVAKAGAAYRNRHRVSRTTPLRVIAPEWVLDAMREDLTQQLPGDSTYAMSDGIISSFLAARNINITWHMDATFGAQGVGALVDFPTTIKWYIFAEGTFLFLDGGTLDLGVVRDSGLVGTNDYRTFVETFEGVAKVGIESIGITTTTHVTGGSVGTVAPS